MKCYNFHDRINTKLWKEMWNYDIIPQMITNLERCVVMDTENRTLKEFAIVYKKGI